MKFQTKVTQHNLQALIRGVGESMQVTEELVELVPMKGRTVGDDMFESLVRALDKLVLLEQKLCLATDGVPQMIGRKAGVAVAI